MDNSIIPLHLASTKFNNTKCSRGRGTAGQIIAIDGKRLRRSHDGRLGKAAIHMVSAWATENRLVLVENKVHWVLDVAFREDLSRVRTGYSAENFAVLRHITLTLLQHETSAKCGVKAKRLKAGWNEDYLLKVLSSLT